MFKSGKGCKNTHCKDANCTNFLCGIAVSVPIFTQYITPNGGLDKEKESHALFYYYLLAQKAVEEDASKIVYEGEKDPEFKQFELCKGVAKMYGVELTAMLNAWKSVDLTCLMHNLPKLPDKYRYPTKITLVTK